VLNTNELWKGENYNMEIKRSIEQGFSGRPGGLFDVLVALKNGQLPISGETYYVSKSGNNTTGLSWETAFNTIAGAITVSNAYIAVTANQYGRNRMYIDGGALWAETLTVLPNQCDMVGVGARTGWRPTIYGATAITTAVTGCHIYNILFKNNVADGISCVIPDGSHGIEFHKCVFSGTGTPTHGLKLGSLADFVVNECRFVGNPPHAIAILCDGTMAIGEIKNNFISATTTGIQIANLTTADYGLEIKGNTIFRADPNSDAGMTTGILFSDAQARSHAVCIGNYIAAANGITCTGTYSGNRDHWMLMGNWWADSDGAVCNWLSPPTTP